MTATLDSRVRQCACPRARHQHGHIGAYRYDHCRCDPCLAANATHARDYRRTVAVRRWNGGSAWTDSTGTRRRLQALACDGWAATQLAPHLDMTDSGVYWLRRTPLPTCLVATATKVQTTYDELWHITPTGNAIDRTILWAERAGWAASWQWEGLDIDDPAVQPRELERELEPCGTPAAYRRHLRRGEPVDEACRGADLRRQAERRTAA